MIVCPENQWSREAFTGSLAFLVAEEIPRRVLMNTQISPRYSIRKEAVERDIIKAMLDAVVPAGAA